MNNRIYNYNDSLTYNVYTILNQELKKRKKKINSH